MITKRDGRYGDGSGRLSRATRSVVRPARPLVVPVLAVMALVMLGVALVACRDSRRVVAPPIGARSLEVAGQQVIVEIADDPDERAAGLMYRKELPENQGMLFIFPRAQTQYFYMKNCLIDIDIAYLADDGVVTDIHTMVVQKEPDVTGYRRYPSTQMVPYALEMNGGWFARHGLKVGDRIDGLPSLSVR